jgi:putative methyltransferase (TIGR04325 family)
MDLRFIRRAIRDITPPLAVRALRSILDRSPEYEYVPEGFGSQVAGYDAEGLLKRTKASWPAFVRALEGTGPLAVNHEASLQSIKAADDAYAHNLLVSFAYVLARAARNRDRISLLDWGGGIGHYYVIARAALPEVEIEYHCRDLPSLNAHGRRLFPEAAFHDDDSCLRRRYDLVLVSGSLHYPEHWQETLTGLALSTERYLYVTRVRTAVSGPSFAIVHRARKHGLSGEVLSWVINRDELVNVAAAAGLQLRRSFRLADGLPIRGAPESPINERGFLFSARDDA